MSQIMQVAKEKPQNSFSTLENDDAKNASFSRLEVSAYDVIGLSWIFLDDPTLYLASSERIYSVMKNQ